MKSRYINIKIGLITLATLLSTTGCNSWLDVKPPNEQTNEEFWVNKEEVDAVVMGAYARMRTALDKLVYWGELRGDMVILGPGLANNEEMNMIKDLEIRPDNSVSKWLSIYSTINRCNSVIKYAPDVISRDNIFTEKVCNAYIAEAKWLRALCYFYLVRAFRDVPYITSPYLDDAIEFRIAKSDGGAILDYIVKDLLESLPNIPVSYGTVKWENKGRATTYAFYALLADIYLWQEKYDDALKMCNNIQKSGLYTLLPTNAWYTLYYPGNSDESIFELQWSNELGQGNALFAWFYNENNNANNLAISEVAKGKYSVFASETDIRGVGGSFVTPNKVWKYAGTARGVSNIRSSEQYDANWIVYRFAEVLLMKAEALAMAGDFTGAYDIVLTIRERAGYQLHPNLPLNEEQALDLIMDERLRELSFEGKRWFDLVRMATRADGKYKNKVIQIMLTNVAPKHRPLFEVKLQNPYGYYFPINADDIDASRGILEQNPYYL